MSSSERTPAPGKWATRILRATLPVGFVLLVVWVVWLGVALRVGVEQSGLNVAQAVLGLVTSLGLIVSGYSYRRALARR
jgi:apolipoprotein N-acyltransferase